MANHNSNDIAPINQKLSSAKSGNKSIGIHQPNFLPWLGYFHKIFLSDIFIFHDNVEYSKKSLTKRTHIRNNLQDREYLGVPLKKTSDYTLIKDLIIDNSTNWQTKRLNIIKNTYRNAIYFDTFYPFLQELIMESNRLEKFSEFSIHAIKNILELLGVQRELYCSSQLSISGNKSAYNINIIKHFDGKIYNSGIGAKKYQSEKEFTDNGIQLNYLDTFTYLESIKNKLPEKFINGVSIIDTLFYVGPEFIINIFHGYSGVAGSES